MGLGNRIHTVRKRRNMSLSELARRAGVSKSLVTQVEHEQTNPSVETVRQLANALEVPLFTFFVEEQSRMIVRKDERFHMTLPGTNVQREILTPHLQGRMAIVTSLFPPGAQGTQQEMTHQGDEWALVLEGTLTVVLAGERHLLHEGDSIYFDAMLPHVFRNESESPTRIIVAFSPPTL